MGLTYLNTEPNLKVLIVANVHKAVFTNAKIKAHFEELFKLYSKETRFDYLPSLSRVRVEYDSEKNAEVAKNAYNKQNVLGNVVQVFYAKVAVTIDRGGGNFLQVPERERNFLISPPASPPVDWEPIPETHPNIDYDLLAAVANLAPGTEHELIPATGNHPGIIVHISENPDGFTNSDRPKIIQTRRPQFNE
ncbi:DgyrCDS10130 [Dimorphilus gyrociliatus]|nr:DgyrCDS10130 [Dimorphilus gyrociliatus]